MLNYIPSYKLDAMTDFEFAAEVFQDRYDRMTNQQTSLARKMKAAIVNLRALDRKAKIKPKNYWQIRFFDRDGEKLAIEEVSTGELTQIGKLIADGYSNGPLLRSRAGNDD